MRGWRVLAVLLVLLLTASTAFAAGFRLPEAGNKANAMAFAFTAQADNPSAIYYNPAGLTQLEGNNIALGVTYVKENGGTFNGFTPVDNFAAFKSETQKDLNFFIPNMYYTHTTKGGWIAYGVGVFAPFGLGQEYENENTSIFRNQITKIDLQTVVVNPTFAFKINEAISVGFGVDFMYGRAELERTPWNPALAAANNGNVYNLDLEGDGTAWGYNFGILVKATPNLRFGANYRSPFTLEIKAGDVNLSNIHPAARAAFGGSTYSTEGGAQIKMPATFAFGAAYTVGRLTVEADADWTLWSSYQSLPIWFSQPVPPFLPAGSDTPKRWEDVWALRTGLEYRVTDPIALRAGFSYDPTPAPAETLGPELPDADRLYYTLGAGFKFGSWTIDISGIYIDKKDRTVNNMSLTTLTGQNGTWTADAWLAGLDIAYKF
ncbi:MAG: aromatic hydrocarbon degradation outer membrane protein [Deltaproteobacteria bacterium]|nr:aromatic hydrocarbon degradation outer membrane protein [Deltaproteobacteria bacterium]